MYQFKLNLNFTIYTASYVYFSIDTYIYTKLNKHP